MARTKLSVKGAPKTKEITGAVGRPSQSVAAIRERYKQEEARQMANYASASAEKVMRTIRDLTRSATTVSLTATDKETIKGYLTGNIYANSANLIAASKYLYLRSPIYAKMVNLYADMYCLQCRKVTPNYSFTKDMDESKTLKQFDATLDFLDILSAHNTLQIALLNIWISDVSFNLFFHDDTGSMLYPIDPAEAVIDSIYEAPGGTTFGMALDMSKWRNAQRQQLIEWFGDPLDSMYREYMSSGVKYIHVPAEYSMVLKQRYESIDTIIPPLLPFLNQLAGLNDLFDNQNDADSLSFFKMIYMPLKTLSAAKNADDFEVTPDLAIDYFKILTDSAIPDGVSSGVIPGDELKTIDFSDTVSQETNRVENSQQQILGAGGGIGALINATKAVNNTALINAMLKAESEYALKGILGQLTAWTNLQLMLNVSNYCRMEYLPITIYTKDEYAKSLLEANQYSYSYRLAYGTLMGFTERQTIAQLKFETEILKLPEVMKFPLQSSYTASGDTEKGEVGEGAPTKDATELSPSGERSRNR